MSTSVNSGYKIPTRYAQIKGSTGCLRTVFRHVLRDETFGELLVGGVTPSQGTHVFASIQSLARSPTQLDPVAYAMVIIDEFHHAAARTYDQLLRRVRPRYLLGLTATPERPDGRDVLKWFGGRVCAELRLWDAIERGLLAPFQYFGTYDGQDLRSVRWTRGRYDDRELARLFTADDVRVQAILEAIRRRVADPRRMRALGFCVSVAHAEFMARKFAEAGLDAISVTGSTPKEERRQARLLLRQRKLCAIFTVDVFSEGVDIPEVDTILMLRPTASATVFLQQLGRGLRLHHEKNCLTVLDFVSNASQRFRFDRPLRALLGERTRKNVQKAVEQRFPRLPSGCAITLDKQSQKIILDHLRRSLRLRQSELVKLLVRLGGKATLKVFLEEAGLSLRDFYSTGTRSFVELRRQAGLETPTPGPDEIALRRGVARMVHLDDLTRIEFLLQAVHGTLVLDALSESERRMLMMLVGTLWGTEGTRDLVGRYRRLLRHAAACNELEALSECLHEQVTHSPPQYRVGPDIPLRLHCSYSQLEIMAAFDRTARDGTLQPAREGVIHHRATGCYLLLTTLRKSEREYSPSTMYADYAISPTLFHWQSQNRTRANSTVGLDLTRHADRGKTPLLFLRESKTSNGMTAPYQFLGPVKCVSHRGEQPMNIEWRLRFAMPSDIARYAKVAA